MTVLDVLATSQTISPKLALRWLRGQAQHIADKLDPERRAVWQQQAGHYFQVPAATCSAQLRAWCEDAREQNTAREQLNNGSPATLVVSDRTDRYTLTVWPLPAPADSGTAATLPVYRQPTRSRRVKCARTVLVSVATLAAYALVGWLLLVPFTR
ncbi:hypothetical protein DY245_08150 [Streptomyces inhibens]|uniref:Uncharacterized protein n=1 Tax=Streptomyces inhibens TaxID=2293571 RepID=A0A371Q7X1_STRIH|nr:hypothetical protein [Streptomyces inhibens]REK90808.1 hypothetical protein DY245_08150 [Streptomyces inhibens]